jgi:glycosyltransferase involved in cell wall biosynthesis
MEKVSVIIPTYNRFKYVLNSINSVRNQTYKNIEIIVINDCSTQNEYYNYDFGLDVKIIHLQENTKKQFGYACAGYVRNKGIEISTGKYVAFLDDDDSWLPHKIELQINAMKETGCKMSCSESFCGYGMYNETINYQKMMTEKDFELFKETYRIEGDDMLKNGYPKIFNKELIKVRNLCTASSVIIEKSILDIINNFKNMKPPGEDYDCWLRALDHTDVVFLNEACMYYDLGHGDGQNY